MMYSRKKSVIFGKIHQVLRKSVVMKYLAIIIFALSVSSAFAQEKDKAFQKSNDFVYQGNTLIGDDFVAAEKEYRKAISKKPSNATGAYNLGNAYYETKNFDEALLRHIEAAKTAKTKAEKHRAFHNIGNTLMQQKKCKEAVEAFKNALRNNPNDEESRYNLVVAKECAKEEQEKEDQNKDKDKKDEEKEDEKKEDKEKEDDGEKEDENDEGDKDKKDGDNKEDDKGKPKDDENEKKDGDPKNKNDKQEQQPGKLSPQQVKNLLEAMSNEEKKVLQKINAKKAKGKKVKAEKDW